MWCSLQGRTRLPARQSGPTAHLRTLAHNRRRRGQASPRHPQNLSEAGVVLGWPPISWLSWKEVSPSAAIGTQARPLTDRRLPPSLTHKPGASRRTQSWH